MRVDLPAPLSPTRATTSPASTLKSTSVSACTAPNRLFTPLSSRTGGAHRSSSFRARDGRTGQRPARPVPTVIRSYWIPAAVHAALYGPVQISAGVQYPSATIVSATFSLVTATGS